eukprot:jgi/Botrbrau1/1347/Bobra.0063s0058.1
MRLMQIPNLTLYHTRRARACGLLQQRSKIWRHTRHRTSLHPFLHNYDATLWVTSQMAPAHTPRVSACSAHCSHFKMAAYKARSALQHPNASLQF